MLSVVTADPWDSVLFSVSLPFLTIPRYPSLSLLPGAFLHAACNEYQRLEDFNSSSFL